MKIAYLLENTSPPCSEVKVVFEHARILTEHGFSVTIFAKGGPPLWYDIRNIDFFSVEGAFADVAGSLLGFDLVIATYYQQVLDLYRASLKLIHFSQGYEAAYSFLKEKRADIEKAYRLPVPKLTISKNIAELVQARFLQSVCYIPRGIDVGAFPVKEGPEHPVQRVIIVGEWENAIKGVPYAVRGFALAKKTFPNLFLVRVSTLPLSDEEKAVHIPDEYHAAVSPSDMASIYLGADLAIVPSLEGDGSDLHAIEAMACGLPVILTRIHSFLSLDNVRDYACFISSGSSYEVSDAIILLCKHPEITMWLRKRARQVAEGFSIEKSKQHLLSAVASLSGHDFTPVENISYIYVKRAKKETAEEERSLSELSGDTFCAGVSITTLISDDPLQVSVGDVRDNTDAPFLAVSLDDTVLFSMTWTRPLVEALKQGFDLASPVSYDFFEIDMPYYSLLTFNDIADRMALKHKGQYRQDIPVRPYVFLVKKSKFDSVPEATLLYDLPKHLKCAFVPASLVHRFGDLYTSGRSDILPFIPLGAKKILDVGCARGMLGMTIKARMNCEVFGVELNEQMADEARTRLDEVFCANIENEDLPFHESLDIIIFADILEHLIGPRSTLTASKRWLKRDGVVVASISNTGHYSFITDLIRGGWDYVPVGLRGVTHLRFFTRRSIEELFRKSGYYVIEIVPQPWPVQLRDKLTEMLSVYVNVESLQEDVFTPGYYVVAQRGPNGDGQ